MKQITIADIIGALCSDDYKGINNQYVGQGKVVIIESICGTQLWWLGRSAESRTTAGFRWKYGGGTENIVVEDMVYPIEGNGAVSVGFTRGQGSKTRGIGYKEEQSPTITAGDVPLAMSTGGVQMAVDVRNSKEADINGALQSRASNNVQSNNVVRQQYAVRRLTPLECERLQGLPDGWTLIDDKSCSDSARYKAIGNGMAQPCADWIIKRIVEEVDGYADKENEERKKAKQTEQG